MNDTTNKHLFGRSDINQKNYYHKTTPSEEAVLGLLKGSPEIDITDIKVYVHDNEIHLEGSVDTIKSKTAVENLIQNYFDEKLVSHLNVKSDQNPLNPLH